VRVERLAQEFDLKLDVCAFDLRPGLPPQGLARAEAYRGRSYPPGYFEHLRQTAAEAGIDMKRPDIVANTRKAHEATEFARDGGRLAAFHRAVFRAYWEDGENISDVDLLCRLAGVCGLDGEELRRALADGRYGPRVDEQMRWSRAAGVGGIPTFIFNERFAVVGAQEYDVFADVAGRIVKGDVTRKPAEEARLKPGLRNGPTVRRA